MYVWHNIIIYDNVGTYAIHVWGFRQEHLMSKRHHKHLTLEKCGMRRRCDVELFESSVGNPKDGPCAINFVYTWGWDTKMKAIRRETKWQWSKRPWQVGKIQWILDWYLDGYFTNNNAGLLFPNKVLVFTSRIWWWNKSEVHQPLN